MKQFRFVKLSGKWFVDIPWNGMIEDLQLVNGADVLLEQYNKDGIVRCSVLEPTDKLLPNFSLACFTRKDYNYLGATYSVVNDRFNGDVWLCSVLKHVFGEYPEYFEIMF